MTRVCEAIEFKAGVLGKKDLGKESDDLCPNCDGIQYINKEPCLKCIEPELLFQHLWTKAVGTKDYNKKQWMALEKFIPLNVRGKE